MAVLLSEKDGVDRIMRDEAAKLIGMLTTLSFE